jgi:YcxB-like protein
MEIEYQLEPRDLERLAIFVHRGTFSGWFLRFLPWIGLLVAVGIAAKLADLRKPADILLALVFFAFLVYFWKRRHRAALKRGAAAFAPQTLSTSAEGLTSSAPGRSGTTAWSVLEGYGETPSHFFLMLDAVAGFVIPKRGLTPEQVAAFAAELGAHARPLPKRVASGAGSLFRYVWLAVGLLFVVFMAWHFAQVQGGQHPATPPGDGSERVFVPGKAFTHVVEVRTDQGMTARVRVGEWLTLYGRRSTGPWIAVERQSLGTDGCWVARPPPEEEAQVADNLRWTSDPAGSGEFNPGLFPDHARRVRFPAAGRFVLRAASPTWCSPPAASNEITVVVTE